MFLSVYIVCLSNQYAMMISFETCRCLFVYPEIFFFDGLKQKNEDVTVRTQGKPSRSQLFFLFDIQFFFRKKKNEKHSLLMLKRRRRLLLLLSFFQCITTMPRFLLAPTLSFSLSFSFHRPGFLFFSFSSFFSLDSVLSFFLSLFFFFFSYSLFE